MARKRKGGRKRRRRNPGMTNAALTALNPRRRRRRYRNAPGRRRRRRNPAFGFGGGRGVVAQLMQGGQDALGIVVGKAASRAIPALVNLTQTGPAGVAIQAASAIAAGWIGSMVNRNFGRMALAGGLAGIVEGFVKVANIPILSASLGDEYDAVMGAYVTEGEAGDERFGLYAGMSEAVEEDATDSVGLLSD